MLNRKYILFLGLIALLTNCTERIDLDLNNQTHQRLVVDAWVTDQVKAHTVRLTLTTDYFENQAAPKAEGAEVTLNDGSNTITLSETSPGLYQTADNFAGVPGRTYTLKIDWDGETYEAVSVMRPGPAIDSIRASLADFEEDDPDDDDDGKLWHDFLFYAQEPAGVGDHYYFKSFVNGDSKSDTLRNNGFASDELVDGMYISGIEYDFLEVVQGDSVSAEMFTISKEAYEYFTAVMLETDWRGGMFDTPPANIPTNISNGALGWFSASSVSANYVIIP